VDVVPELSEKYSVALHYQGIVPKVMLKKINKDQIVVVPTKIQRNTIQLKIKGVQ
jgi:hypothetical protein